MNREIKFRGKRVDNGEWIYGNLIKEEDHYYISVAPLKIQLDDGYWEHSYGYPPCATDFHLENNFEVIPETVGQFTGLKDNNGEEIYEGDVITDDEFPHYLCIGYNYDATSFCGSKTSDFSVEGCFWFYNDIVMTDGWVVIGNIYDNPELIK